MWFRAIFVHSCCGVYSIKEICQSFIFLTSGWYVLSIQVIMKFTKDNALMFETLQDLVKETINNASINSMLDEEVSEFMLEVTDKRRLRKMKKLKLELDEFIKSNI